MIRYAEIIDESVVDGLGIRVTAFLQGCPRRCEACHNPQLLPMKGVYKRPRENWQIFCLAG